MKFEIVPAGIIEKKNTEVLLEVWKVSF